MPFGSAERGATIDVRGATIEDVVGTKEGVEEERAEMAADITHASDVC